MSDDARTAEPATPSSPLRRFKRDDRRFAAAFGMGASAAILGGAWILLTFTRRPAYDFAYHVPIAFVVVGAVVDAWNRRREHPATGFFGAMLLASAYTAGRIAFDWPLSGHGVYGVLIAIAGPRRFWRVSGVAIAVQALITKWVVDERPECALYGVLGGAALGFIARRTDRARRRPTAPS